MEIQEYFDRWNAQFEERLEQQKRFYAQLEEALKLLKEVVAMELARRRGKRRPGSALKMGKKRVSKKKRNASKRQVKKGDLKKAAFAVIMPHPSSYRPCFPDSCPIAPAKFVVPDRVPSTVKKKRRKRATQ